MVKMKAAGFSIAVFFVVAFMPTLDIDSKSVNHRTNRLTSLFQCAIISTLIFFHLRLELLNFFSI